MMCWALWLSQVKKTGLLSVFLEESLVDLWWYYFLICFIQGFWYFAKKKQNFAGFSGANSRKNRPISRDFRGRKVKIRRKIGWFHGILAEKSQILKDFRGNFRGKLCQETISKKQPISLDFVWQISLKSINFASIWPALFNVFLTGVIICSFNNSSLEKWANAKAINIMVSAQFFATFI